MMNADVKYVADLAQVREVSLLGWADLAFWKDRLREEDLAPAEEDGRAQLLIVAAAATFRGIRFRELSVSVLVARRGEGCRRDAAFLVQAFNSSRILAFCERAFFSTPYDHGDVRLSASIPASLQLIEGGETVFRAEMQAGASTPRREPSQCGEDGWEGPIFLPGDRRRTNHPGKVFLAQLRGQTETYPFLLPEDRVAIKPSPASPIFQALIDSCFVGKAWTVRADARHARSKTYKRSELPTGRPRG